MSGKIQKGETWGSKHLFSLLLLLSPILWHESSHRQYPNKGTFQFISPSASQENWFMILKKRGNLNSLNSMHVINLLLSLFLISHTKLNLQDVEKTSHQANPCESDSYPQYIGSSPPFPRRKTIPACLCQLPSDQCLELNSWKTLGSSWKLF